FATGRPSESALQADPVRAGESWYRPGRARRQPTAEKLAFPNASGSADVALLARIDLDPLAGVDEQRHLDDGAGLELRRLRHVRDRIALHAGLGVRDGQLDGCGKLDPGRLSVHEQHLDRARRLHELERVLDRRARQRGLLVRVLVHEDDLVPRVVEVLHVLRLGPDPRKLLACSEGTLDDGAARECLQFRAHERAALPRLHMLELDDAPHVPIELDVHAVLELIRVDGLRHRANIAAADGAGNGEIVNPQPTSTRSFRTLVRFSPPSSVTWTSSSIRIPPSPGR